MQEVNQVRMPLELNYQEVSQGLILSCETGAQRRAPVCRVMCWWKASEKHFMSTVASKPLFESLVRGI